METVELYDDINYFYGRWSTSFKNAVWVSAADATMVNDEVSSTFSVFVVISLS